MTTESLSAAPRGRLSCCQCGEPVHRPLRPDSSRPANVCARWAMRPRTVCDRCWKLRAVGAKGNLFHAVEKSIKTGCEIDNGVLRG